MTSGQPGSDLAKDARAFACPGLFRIVPALDGGICRIKLPLGYLSARQARAIASIAEAHAGGIEATNRANVQIRGVRPGHENDVIAALRATDLGGANAGADDVRNVMVSPLIGLDARQILDARPLAEAILACLQDEARYHVLSPKFSFSIDGGEAIARLDHPNDIWLSAVDPDTYAFGFAGCPPRENMDPRDHCAGFVAADKALEFVTVALDFFLQHRGRRDQAGNEIARFRHLLADLGLEEILKALPVAIRRDLATSQWRRLPVDTLAHLGRIPLRDPEAVAIGALPPLGRLSADMLRGLADLADATSGGEIRMTPWQSVILPNVAAENGNKALAMLEARGFVTRRDQALAGMVSCAGNAGCASAHADALGDAKALAGQLAESGTGVFGIHVSGCGKSCAAPRPAEATLIAVSPGQYDAFWRDASAASKFGRRIGGNLSIKEASRILARKRKQQG